MFQTEFARKVVPNLTRENLHHLDLHTQLDMVVQLFKEWNGLDCSNQQARLFDEIADSVSTGSGRMAGRPAR
jgi:hypothetical protein